MTPSQPVERPTPLPPEILPPTVPQPEPVPPEIQDPQIPEQPAPIHEPPGMTPPIAVASIVTKQSGFLFASQAAERQSGVDSLAKASGADFDRQLIHTVGLADHKEHIAMFESASQTVSDPKLKAWIDKTLPRLREHLSVAQRLQSLMSSAKTSLSTAAR